MLDHEGSVFACSGMTFLSLHLSILPYDTSCLGWLKTIQLLLKELIAMDLYESCGWLLAIVVTFELTVSVGFGVLSAVFTIFGECGRQASMEELPGFFMSGCEFFLSFFFLLFCVFFVALRTTHDLSIGGELDSLSCFSFIVRAFLGFLDSLIHGFRIESC